MENNITYPYTKLVGHTWEALSYTDSLTATPFYQFIHVKSDTTVGVYTASYDASLIIVPEIVYPGKIITHANHADVLQILYPGYPQPFELHTTVDTTVITTGSWDYKRFK